MSPEELEVIQREANAAAQRLARRLNLSADARCDVCQELLADLLARLRHFDPARGALGAFAGRIVTNQACCIAKRILRERRVTQLAAGQKVLHQPLKRQLLVREGVDGARIGPGEIWIAPGDFHMTVRRTADGCHLGLNQGPPENSCRPAVDVLLRSAIAAYGGRVLAVILTGMGRDGASGLLKMRHAGARTIGQNEKTCVVYGMPRVAHELGAVEHQLPLTSIGEEILKLTAARKEGIE